jgi:hypothetical protein
MTTAARAFSPDRLFALSVRGSLDCQYAFPGRKGARSTLDVLPRTLPAEIVELVPSDKPTCFVVLVEGQRSWWTFTSHDDAKKEAAGRHVSLDGQRRKASVLPCAARAS